MISSEPDANDKIISSKIKEWTGNDKIQARDLCASNTEFHLQAGFNILCNAIPQFTTLKSAEAKRSKIINYPYQFVDNPILLHEKQIDMSLKDKFRKLEYAQQNTLILIDCYKQNAHNKQQFPIPDKVNAFTNEYFNDNDSVGQFVKEYIKPSEDVIDKIERKDLYAEFVEFTKK